MWTERKLQNQAEKIFKVLKLRGATLDIFLLPHAAMKKMKAQFKMKPTEPNVLSFRNLEEFPEPEKGKGKKTQKYLGEIYLNKDILAKSPKRAVPLLLHGVLHLLGHDHKDDVDAVEMEEREAIILAKLTK